jgi:hypothetical protein
VEPEFIIMFIRASHWPLSWARLIQSSLSCTWHTYSIWNLYNTMQILLFEISFYVDLLYWLVNLYWCMAILHLKCHTDVASGSQRESWQDKLAFLIEISCTVFFNHPWKIPDSTWIKSLLLFIIPIPIHHSEPYCRVSFDTVETTRQMWS